MIKDVLDLFRPPDNADARAVRRWRSNVASGLMFGFVVGAWALSDWGFARAGDVEKKVEQAVGPVRSEIEGLKGEQRQQRALIEETRLLAIENQAADYEGKIVDFKTRQCKASKDEAAATWRTLVLDYQNRYLKLTGRNFPAPSCADL